jgi:glycine cleavage system aminomethyltransferase T
MSSTSAYMQFLSTFIDRITDQFGRRPCPADLCCVYNGRLMAVDHGGDRFEEYWKQRREAGLVDTGERPTEIVGPDAEAFCIRLFTRNCSTLKPGRAGYGVLLYPDGGILCDGILMRLEPECRATDHSPAGVVARAEGRNA